MGDPDRARVDLRGRISGEGRAFEIARLREAGLRECLRQFGVRVPPDRLAPLLEDIAVEATKEARRDGG